MVSYAPVSLMWAIPEAYFLSFPLCGQSVARLPPSLFYHMLKENLFNESEFNLVKKCVIFYMVIGKTTDRPFNEVLIDFETKINAYMVDKVPQYLSSTLKKDDKFSMIDAVNMVKDFVSTLMNLNESETKFINEFENSNYHPELLFDDNEIIDRIKNHPMALWKISNKQLKNQN